jgi:hypothetical protein
MAETLSSTIEGLHEDLGDELALLDNENTIFSSTVQSGGKAKASEYKRVADKQLSGRLGARSEASAMDRTKVTNQFTNRKKISGIVQQKRESWGVSRRAQKVENAAGEENLEGESRYRGLERHKQGKELTYLSQQVQADNATAYNDEGVLDTVHLTQGASAWCESDAQTNSEYAVPSEYRPASAQIVNIASVTAFTEAQLRTLLLNARKAKRKNVKLTNFCTTDFANQLATFFDSGSTANSQAPIRRFNQDGTSGEITAKLTGYNTAFGSMMVVPTELLNATRNAGSITAASGSNGDATITCASTAGLQAFMKVSGTSVPAGAYIASITDATHFELSANLTGDIAAATLVVGEYDHALMLEMEYFFELLNGLEEVDLSPDGSGSQGYVEEFFSLFCSMPFVQSKVVTRPS